MQKIYKIWNIKKLEIKTALKYISLWSFLANKIVKNVQGGSNMTGTDLCVNKPHCATAVRPW